MDYLHALSFEYTPDYNSVPRGLEDLPNLKVLSLKNAELGGEDDFERLISRVQGLKKLKFLGLSETMLAYDIENNEEMREKLISVLPEGCLLILTDDDYANDDSGWKKDDIF